MLYAGLFLAIAAVALIAYRARSSSTREVEVVRDAVACIRREEVPVLAAECERTARDHFGVELRGAETGRGLERIEMLLRENGNAGTVGFREAFAGPAHPDRYVAVVGSWVGELIRGAGEAEWESGPDAPLLRLHDGQRRRISPFAEVIRTVRQPNPAPLVCRMRGRAGRARAGAMS